MRIAVYGGSFNPPHVGHAMVASWLHLTWRADEVWFVPTYAHAFEKVLAPWECRLRMVDLLANSLGPWARVEPIEVELPTPSFTINTLDALAARHPEHRFSLVVGSDVVEELPSWQGHERIRSDYGLLVVGRAGHVVPDGILPMPDVSSTTVRERIALGLPIDHLVSKRVEAYIDSYRLYRVPGEHGSIARLPLATARASLVAESTTLRERAERAEEEVAELRATLLNEHGEGEPPCEGWAWDSGEWWHGGVCEPYATRVFRLSDGWGWCVPGIPGVRRGWNERAPTAREAMRAATKSLILAPPPVVEIETFG